MTSNIAALIVTYNRIDLLKESIKSILNQTISVNHLIIINNDSDDGTYEYLKTIKNKKIIIKNLDKNVGGAGGFYEGIKLFQSFLQDDYIWIMDDDTIPNIDSLKNIDDAIQNIGKFGFLASNIRWIDGSVAKMNLPAISNNDWCAFVNKRDKNFYPRIKSASFVSLVIPRGVIDKVGLPIKEFFIWGDDVEYTSRISDKYSSFFVPNSVAIHKMKVNHGVDIVHDNSERINRYFYSIRNRMYRARINSGRSKFVLYRSIIRDLIKVMFFKNVKSRLKKIKIIFKGIFKGVFFSPQIKFVNDFNESENK